MDWNLNLKRLMGEATQLVRSGQLADATRAIQQTLGEAVARHGPLPHPPAQAPPAARARARTHGRERPRWRSAHTAQEVEDAVVIDRSTHAPPAEAQPTTTPRPAASHHPLAEPLGASPAWPSPTRALGTTRTTTTCTCPRAPRQAPPCPWC